MATARDTARDAQLDAERLALCLRQLLKCAPEPPCVNCRKNDGAELCFLCRWSKSAREALHQHDKG